MESKAVIAVIFGGRSVEHDVSILTGLQFLEALDPELYSGLPVYVDPTGQWWTGETLRRRSFYPLSPHNREKLMAITLPVGTAMADQPHFLHAEKGLFGQKVTKITFDLAVPAIHGSFGEDGSLQGMLSYCGIPFAGPPALGAAAAMDKAFCKSIMSESGVPVLPHAILERPPTGQFPDREGIVSMVRAAMPDQDFPLIVKPNQLGSSIAVARVNDPEELTDAVLTAFRFDHRAIVEPFVDHLAEYNIAVRRADGEVLTSAIERPLRDSDLLDFKNKYLAGGGGAKSDAAPSEGMVSANRELHPAELSRDKDQQIRKFAQSAFERLQLAGSIRVDFLCNSQTGDIWFNEVNTIPGSFAYYLWTEAEPALGYTDLSGAIVEEGFASARGQASETGSAAGGGQIFSDRRI